MMVNMIGRLNIKLSMMDRHGNEVYDDSEAHGDDSNDRKPETKYTGILPVGSSIFFVCICIALFLSKGLGSQTSQRYVSGISVLFFIPNTHSTCCQALHLSQHII